MAKEQVAFQVAVAAAETAPAVEKLTDGSIGPFVLFVVVVLLAGAR